MPKTILTSERKSQLREEVLLELEKNETNKKITVVKKTPVAVKKTYQNNVSILTKTEEYKKTPVVVKPLIKKKSAPKAITPKNSAVVQVKSRAVLKTVEVKPKKLTKKKPILTVKKEFSPSDFMPRLKPQELLAPVISDRIALPSRPRIALLSKPKVVLLPERNKRRRIWFLILLITLLILVAVLFLDIFGIYRLGWQDRISYDVANFLSLPAGTIDGDQIKLVEYFDDLNTAKSTLSDSQKSIKDLGDEVFNTLAVNDLIYKELDRYGQPITSSEIEKEWQRISVTPNLADTIKKSYDSAVNKFKEKAIKPAMAKERLQQLIIDDGSLEVNSTAKKKAETILALASVPGIDFGSLAEKYSDDLAGAAIGGDMGWVIKGEISPELEQPLFSASTSSVYGEPIKSQGGYHIVKTEEKLTDKESGQESVKARQILVAIDINNYLKELMDKATIKKFVRKM